MKCCQAILFCTFFFGHLSLRSSLEFITPAPCTTLHSSWPLTVNVSIRHDLPKGECVIVHVRSSNDKAWWFMVPPSPLKDRQYRFCVDVNRVLSGAVELPLGYTRLAAWWDQPSWSSKRPTPSAVGYVSLLLPNEDHDVRELTKISSQARQERDYIVDDPHKSRTLSHKYERIAKHPGLQHATIATPGLLDERLLKALSDGSPKAMWSVIKEAGVSLSEESVTLGSSPACSGKAAWKCQSGHEEFPWLRTKAAHEPVPHPGVYRLPIFSIEMAELLLQELEAANDSPLAGELTQPQNADNTNRKPGQPPGAVMLAEIGLGSLADSLIRDVLKPIGRLVYPHWDSDGVDSWHGFSIHRKVPTRDKQAAMIRDHISKEGIEKVSEGAKHLGINATAVDAALSAEDPQEALFIVLSQHVEENGWPGTNVEESFQKVRERKDPGHNDVCEISINICLGRNFTESGVFFAGFSGMHDASAFSPIWVPQVPGTGYIHVCQHQHGVIGPAAGERHSIVIRALSSRFRAAPAENFAMQCLDSS